MLKCVLENEEASENIKEYAKKMMASTELTKIKMHDIEINQNDKNIMRKCWDNVKESSLISRPRIRHLSEDNSIKEDNGFNPSGILPCIEHLQPSAKIIRTVISLIKSQDYFAAIQTIWDNIGVFTEAAKFCYNSIFNM